MPSADFCRAITMNYSTLRHVSVTCRRSPEVSSTAFRPPPLDLPPVPLMDMGFAVICQLARHPRPPHPVLVHRLAPFLHASFRPFLAVGPFRFAITSPPSGCEKDLHLQAVEHARHTNKKGDLSAALKRSEFYFPTFLRFSRGWKRPRGGR